MYVVAAIVPCAIPVVVLVRIVAVGDGRCVVAVDRRRYVVDRKRSIVDRWGIGISSGWRVVGVAATIAVVPPTG
jgi:hypothetical protein